MQLHLVEMIKAKKSGAGHKMYKVCRRVLQAPIVKEDTYCLEVVGKELRGEGEVNAQGQREGRGTMVWADGDMHEGQWRAGLPHGQCKWTGATGDVYEGEWVEDKKQGYGKYSFSVGNVYEGEWVAGEKHGRGKFTIAGGDSYEGEWAEGKWHGKGTYTFADGTEFKVYQGEFLHGKRHGRGKITYTNGNSHDGEYAEDKEHGHGTFTFADGKVQIGYYEPGEPYVGHGVHVGQGVRWSADRREAWEVQDGKEVRGIPLDEAAKMAERIGLPPP